MLVSEGIKSYDGISKTVKFVEADLCPSCHRGIRPVFVSGYIESSTIFSIFNYCTMCANSFISKYEYVIDPRTGVHSNFIESLPIKFRERTFEDKINKLSPNFSNVYNQAKKAEDFGLNEIAGMGYRKSLEILIKDYSIFLNPDKRDKIIDPKFTLTKCIESYILDPQLSDLSRLTSWLGNDETHYTRVHLDKDINDLKEYLDATIFFINYDLTAKKAFPIVNP